MYEMWLAGMSIKYVTIGAFAPKGAHPLSWLASDDGQRCYATIEKSIRRSCKKAK